jgi:hypothetical protein
MPQAWLPDILFGWLLKLELEARSGVTLIAGCSKEKQKQGRGSAEMLCTPVRPLIHRFIHLFFVDSLAPISIR